MVSTASTYAGELWQTTKDAFSGTPSEVGSDLLSQVGTLVKGAATEKVTASSISIGDYTLVGVGIVLAIGALLISQKHTAVKIVTNATKAVTA